MFCVHSVEGLLSSFPPLLIQTNSSALRNDPRGVSLKEDFLLCHVSWHSCPQESSHRYLVPQPIEAFVISHQATKRRHPIQPHSFKPSRITRFGSRSHPRSEKQMPDPEPDATVLACCWPEATQSFPEFPSLLANWFD
ncbi:uncharacterized protein MELLADRAFT_96030 [Melampsora larici-populina 98AG31]|uniref:Uncharacterized protein n=1 Tax=Melampsora larici-populina (strain 98AG31 / pathotype 3-4-7) TaxID=747676 RepID=F4SAN1_MELLP|nr:uncharacterized protein MELLADRAFT_96030 [Melampsora larici-populina 98AG31]EGF98295.1 hypothetical protein MELLADRAFT_96030 [Melampsora larici-populina 98AG31]